MVRGPLSESQLSEEPCVTQEQAFPGTAAVDGVSWDQPEGSTIEGQTGEGCQGAAAMLSVAPRGRRSASCILVTTPGKVAANYPGSLTETSGSWRSEKDHLWETEAGTHTHMHMHTCARKHML